MQLLKIKTPDFHVSMSQFGRIFGVLVFCIFAFWIDLDPNNPTISYMAGIAALMAVWWITEAVPLAVTSLLPVALYPLFDISTGKVVASAYMNYIIFLFLGGFLLALAMEKWNLHRRIALFIILTFGRSTTRLIFGFMVACATLSMWISNTATTMMMFPIAVAILIKFEELTGNQNKNLNLSLLLAIAYACTIGGMATLVGTPPNLVLVQVYDATFSSTAGFEPVLFSEWFIFALPISIIMLIVTWWLLTHVVYPVTDVEALDHDIIEDEYRKLGSIRYEEVWIMVIFFIVALGWIFRKDIDLGVAMIPGWSNMLTFAENIDDGTVVIFCVLILFLVPSRHEQGEHILGAKVFSNIPWHIILFFGGGFALAKGMMSSGLSAFIAGQLTVLQGVHPLLIVFTIAMVVSFLTEITSNLASTQMLLPILGSMAVALDIAPLMLLIPATLAASMAFMLPIATPPNAIIFGSGRIQIKEMVKAGVWLNMTGVVLVTLFCYFLLETVF